MWFLTTKTFRALAIPKRIQTVTLPDERRRKQRDICPYNNVIASVGLTARCDVVPWTITFTFSHFADAFIQSDLQLGIHKAINLEEANRQRKCP